MLQLQKPPPSNRIYPSSSQSLQPLQPDWFTPQPQFQGDLNDPAVSQEDQALLQGFVDKLYKEKMERCTRCQRFWFNLDLNFHRICKVCRTCDTEKKRGEGGPLLFCDENKLDFGEVSAHLPALSQVEEQLIARVHVYCDICCVRGQQYRYRGVTPQA
ncbi:hypothetical protein QBC38DRAFT_494479 [Podospora fimiseda]|uniref:DUF6570 domain-containing protein n=1 Tax=Podospora fimiseda TaxID=252190 RepID=A0AAN6YLU9_9PEZI|nr:hypothetical protein QBC38DRAFT_494479 [Podospora fimiseda]